MRNCRICIDNSSFEDIRDELEGRNKRREFIKTMNYFNLLISVICSVLFIILGVATDYRCCFWFNLVLFLLCLRAISRSYEIIKAFLNDVLQPDNNRFSSLKYYERLGLALTGLFEVGINYSLIYYFCLGNWRVALEKSVGNKLLVNVNEINLITVLQVLTSMTLIYLALANYIGSKDEGELE